MPSSQLKGLLCSDGVHDKLDGEGYQFIDVVLPFIRVYVDNVSGYIDDAKLTRVSTISFELLLESYSRRSERTTDSRA